MSDEADRLRSLERQSVRSLSPHSRAGAGTSGKGARTFGRQPYGSSGVNGRRHNNLIQRMLRKY
jgi:hypothetical protein